MIKISMKTLFNKSVLSKAVDNGRVKALKRAGAFMMGVARRMIKKRKHKSSPPGQPPYEHGSFKRTIIFAVNNIAAYVGPRMTSGRKNSAGQPVPNVLEFGGESISATNAAWWVKNSKADLRNIRSKSGVASYLRSAGYGPMYIGKSTSSVTSAASRGKRRKSGAPQPKWRDKIRKRYSPVLRKNVFVLTLPLKSDRMVSRAADNVVKYFGYPSVPESKVAARPFMGPSLEGSKSYIAGFFRNLINK